MNEIIAYKNTENIYDDICKIIEASQRVAYQSVNITLVLRNWLLGRRISEEELKGTDRAEYGLSIIDNLSSSLTEKYGKGFTRRTLYKYVQIYKCFPEIVRSVTAQSSNDIIVPSLTAQLLSWSHYEKLLQVQDEKARAW